MTNQQGYEVAKRLRDTLAAGVTKSLAALDAGYNLAYRLADLADEFIDTLDGVLENFEPATEPESEPEPTGPVEKEHSKSYKVQTIRTFLQARGTSTGVWFDTPLRDLDDDYVNASFNLVDARNKAVAKQRQSQAYRTSSKFGTDLEF